MNIDERLARLERMFLAVLDRFTGRAEEPPAAATAPPKSAVIAVAAPTSHDAELEKIQRDFDWLRSRGAVTRLTIEQRR